MDVSTIQQSPVRTRRGRHPRLTIVDRHAAFADALEGVLWGRFRVRQVITTERSTVAGVVSAARSGPPDLVLVTTRLGRFLEGDAVVDGLVAHGLTVLALCPADADQDPVTWGRCLRAGALTVASQESGLHALQEALDEALAGRSLHSEAAVADLVAGADRADGDAGRTALALLDTLSLREREILTHLMAGRCAAEIARECVVAEATVRTQTKAILAKLGVNSQLAAVAVAHRAGWSAPSDRWLSVAS
jgi:two-component system, NarL family, nitrate/nitrite response regulator NarL